MMVEKKAFFFRTAVGVMVTVNPDLESVVGEVVITRTV